MKLIKSLLLEEVTLQTPSFTAKLVDTMEIGIEFKNTNVVSFLYLELDKHSQSQLNDIDHEPLGDEVYFDITYTVGKQGDFNNDSIVGEGMFHYSVSVEEDNMSYNPNISDMAQYWDNPTNVGFEDNNYNKLITALSEKGVKITPDDLKKILLKFGDHMIDVVSSS